MNRYKVTMNIQLLLVLFSFFITQISFAQRGVESDIYSTGYNTGDNKGFSSVDEARNIINNIISVVGLKPKFEIKAANIPNAAAVIYGPKRYILYNPSFVTQLDRAAGTKWASVSILAHEIGHHLNGHTLEHGGSRPEIELEADEFSGFVLRKMGASLSEAQLAMKIAASQKASHTHPGQADRLYAIAKGWNSASNQISGNSNIAKINNKPETIPNSVQQPVIIQKKETIVKPQATKIALADKYILKDAVFHNDPHSDYHLTIRGNLVRLNEDGLTVLGSIKANRSNNFPLVIQLSANNYWFINTAGRIYTNNGREIGYISNHG